MTIMTAPGSPTIAYRANTTATTLIRSQCRASTTTHDSDSIAYRANTTATTLIRSQCRARPDGISSVSRADASRFIAPGIATTHARHHHDPRQASARPTACDASGYTPGTTFGHAPSVASGQPTVVIISPPELGGVRGGLNRH